MAYYGIGWNGDGLWVRVIVYLRKSCMTGDFGRVLKGVYG